MDSDGAGRRAGTFFILLGVLSLVLFGASDVAGSTYYPLFCVGGVFFFAGWFLRTRNRVPGQPDDSGRFGLFRRKPKEPNDKKQETNKQ